VIVEGTDMIIEFCYGQCSVECVPNPNPADITFRVNMSDLNGNSIASADGVYLIGNFTNPQWQGGAIQMTNTGANVYEATANVSGAAQFQYKFVNGLVSNSANEEGAGIADCGVANGIGGYNRVHDRTGEAETLSVVCFSACTDCVVNVNENAFLSSLLVFPNPAEDRLTVKLNAATAQNIQIQLINNVGQVVYSKNAGTLAGDRQFEIEVAQLSAGVYNLVVSNGTGIQTKTVSIK
jgi:hypothetical protein